MSGRAIASVCRWLSGATVEWRCDPCSEAQRIYFANHSSHLDFQVIWSALPPPLRRHARPVAGRDYWERTAVRRCLARRMFRAVLIERRSAGHEDDSDAARASVELMAAEMGWVDSLIVFPEGTRSADGAIGQFKSGLYHLARARPDAELIPVHLDNLNRMLPKGETLPVPMLSHVTFGPALPIGRDEQKEPFLVRSRNALVQLGGVA